MLATFNCSSVDFALDSSFFICTICCVASQLLSTAAMAPLVAVVASAPLMAAMPVTRLVMRLRLPSRCVAVSSGLVSLNRPVNKLLAAAPSAPEPQL